MGQLLWKNFNTILSSTRVGGHEFRPYVEEYGWDIADTAETLLQADGELLSDDDRCKLLEIIAEYYAMKAYQVLEPGYRVLQIDSREKAWIGRMKSELGPKFLRTEVVSLLVGDYKRRYGDVAVERKATLRELYISLMQSHRLPAELQRAADSGIYVHILLQQTSIDGRPITCLDDIGAWSDTWARGQCYGYGARLLQWLRELRRGGYTFDMWLCGADGTADAVYALLTPGADVPALRLL